MGISAGAVGLGRAHRKGSRQAAAGRTNKSLNRVWSYVNAARLGKLGKRLGKTTQAWCEEDIVGTPADNLHSCIRLAACDCCTCIMLAKRLPPANRHFYKQLQEGGGGRQDGCQ